MSTRIVPIVLLASGAALSAAGLVATFLKGPAAPPAAFALMLVGIVDGVAGLVWASATILWGAPASGEPVGPAGAAVGAERERERMRRTLLATGVLSIVFLGVLAAIAFRIPIIIGWLRASRGF